MKTLLDMLITIKNAAMVQKDVVKTVVTKRNIKIAELLVGAGYIESSAKKGRGTKRYLELKLKYNNGVSAIENIRFISKPGRRVYRKSSEIRRVRNGYGISIISTSSGIITDKEARFKKVGGEVLFEVY